MAVHNSRSEEETARIAAALASTLRSGDMVCLRGDLGAGKSVFARALIRALCGDPRLEVPSPTFILVQTYDARDATVWHYDLYRLIDADEVHELGWEECRSGIAVVEWPERAERLLPRRRIEVAIVGGGSSRSIAISAVPS